MTFRSLSVVLVLLLGLTAPASAQTFTWNRTTNGNWNDLSSWLDSGNNPAVATSGTTTALVFNASDTTSYTATNDIGAFTLNSMTFNNTGTGLITITGPAANTITFAGTAPSINVSAGSVLFTGLMVGSATVTKTGAGTFIHDSNNTGFTGTLVINGGTFVNQSSVNAVANFNPVSIVVNSGGTYQFGNATVGDPNLPNSTYVTVNSGGTVNWQEGETFGGLHLQGGTVNLQQGGMTSSGTTAQTWTSGTLTGGAFTVGGAAAINKTTSGTVTISGGASVVTTSSFNIQDGTVTHVAAANLGTANISLGAAATTGTFEYQGATASRAGTFAVNAGGGVIRVTSAASVLTLTGAFSGAGVLTKDGDGTLALTGTLGHGGSAVSAGTLLLNPVSATGGVTVANGAILAINSGAGTASFSTPSLSLGNSAATVRLDLMGTTLPTVPTLIVSGADGLTLNGGTHTLSVTNVTGIPNGSFTAIDYTGTPITSGFNLLLPGRTAGNLFYDTANTQINVSITGTDTVKWTGAVSATWDVGTAANVGGTNNWQLVTAGSVTNFINTDTLTFDDSSTARTINITSLVQPASVTVNTANTYTFQGAGSIGGTTALVKQGTGSVVLSTANTYTGGTTISAGSLVYAGETVTSTTTAGFPTGIITSSPVGTGAVILGAGSTFTTDAANRAMRNDLQINGTAGSPSVIQIPTGQEFTLTGNTTGGATVVNKMGDGLWRITGDSTFTGTLNINAGTVLLTDFTNGGTGGDLDASLIVINNGGKFQFATATTFIGENPDLPANTIVRVNTGGVAEWHVGEDYGAIELFGGAYNTRINNNLGLTSNLESGTISSINGATGSLAGAGLIQKTTSGTVVITGVALNNTGGLAIDAGVLSTDSAIGGSGNVTIGAAGVATLQYRGTNATVSRPISLEGGSATLDVTQATTAYTLSGVISGVGTLTKAGSGTLILTGNNTYNSSTTITGGTLLVNGQTGTNSGTGSGPVSVNLGGTLGGTGRVAGTITVNAGGAIRGGAPGGTGTLTVDNSITINSSSSSNGIFRVEASRTGSGTADASRIVLSGEASVLNLNPGAGNRFTIDLVNGATSLQDGETYSIVLATVSTPGNIRLNGASLGANATINPSNYVLQSSGLNGFNSFSLSVDSAGTGLVLSFQPVPEPATVLGLAAGALGLGGLIRRYRKATPVTAC